MRRLVVVLLVIGGVLGVLRRRRDTQFVDVRFEDGSTVRLARGIEASDLLDDADAILEATA